MNILLILAGLAFLIGAFALQSATASVALIGMACFFAVLARIAQADQHHAALARFMASLERDGDSAEDGQ